MPGWNFRVKNNFHECMYTSTTRPVPNVSASTLLEASAFDDEVRMLTVLRRDGFLPPVCKFLVRPPTLGRFLESVHVLFVRRVE